MVLSFREFVKEKSNLKLSGTFLDVTEQVSNAMFQINFTQIQKNFQAVSAIINGFLKN